MSNDFDYFNFCREQYSNEVNRKNEISNSLSTTIGLISALVVAAYYLITSFDYSLNILLTIIHTSLLITVIIYLSLSIIQLIKFFSNYPKGYTYAYLENSDELDEYRKKLMDYHKNAPTEVDKDLQDHVLDYLVQANTINQKNNDKKIKHRVRCHNHMIVAFIGICALLIPFGINYGMQCTKKKIQQIEIVNSPEYKSSNQKFTRICPTKTKKVKEGRGNRHLHH